MPSWERINNLNNVKMNNLKLNYFSSSYVDYELDKTQDFIYLFRNRFKTEPEAYAFSGFDITYYFISSLFYMGNDFNRCLEYFPMELLQGTFSFNRVGNTNNFENNYWNMLQLKKMSESKVPDYLLFPINDQYVDDQAIKYISFTFYRYIIFTSCKDTRKKYWDSGNIQSELEYKDNKLNGKAIWYYENGNKEQEVNYINNTLEGAQIRWYQNGNFESKAHYKNGNLEGLATMYDEYGNLLSEENYKNDTLNGSYILRYPSGGIRISGSYVGGYFSGQWLYYNLSGEIIGTGNYTMGSGIQKAWHPNGELMREITYVNNLKHGTEKWYNAEGVLEKVLYYKEGVLSDNEQ